MLHAYIMITHGPAGGDPNVVARRPAALWIDPHPLEAPRPGTIRLPSEAGESSWYGFSLVTAHVYVGAQLGSHHPDGEHRVADAAFLKQRGIRAVLDMRQEGPDEAAVLEPEAITYRHIKVEDHYAPTVAQLEEAVQFIRAYADRNVDIYVHCHAGRARSATAVLAYLISHGRSLGEALGQVEGARIISVRWNHADLESLREYATHLGRPELGTPDAGLPPHQLARPVIRAAGGVIRRRGESGQIEVLLIHRPHRDDWTFPKGKVEDGETEESCALREIEEETGLRCAFSRELPGTSHIDHKGRLKVVRYWLMDPLGGDAAPRNEVDAVRWLPVTGAAALLSYERDRALLGALGPTGE
jgi:8-oxo-dGTP diphosphatase